MKKTFVSYNFEEKMREDYGNEQLKLEHTWILWSLRKGWSNAG